MISRSQSILAFAAAATKNNTPTYRGTGEALRTEGRTVRARSASAWRNSPVVGNGIRVYRRGLLSWLQASWATDEAQDTWEAWARHCGYRHNSGSLGHVLFRAAHQLAQDGEVFIHRARVSTMRNNHPNGLLLQVWPAHLLDRHSSFEQSQSIIDGIEYRDGLPIAALFRAASSSPTDYRRWALTRIPFDDLIWLRYAPHADQAEGLAPSHAAIKADAELASFAETALVQQRIQSCLAAVLLADEPMVFDKSVELGPRVTDVDGNTVEELEPGSFVIAHNIKSAATIQPEIAPFPVEQHVARVASGMGLTTETIGGTAGRASFSALRMARLAEREVTDEFAVAVDWPAALAQIVEWYVEAEMVMGRAWRSSDMQWLQRDQMSLDEEKQAKSEALRLENGTVSRTELIRRTGRNPRRVLGEIESEQTAGAAPEGSDPDRELRVVA